MKSTNLLLGIWLVLAGLTATAGAQQGTLKEIAPGVWFREGEMGSGHCNNVIIEMTDYLIIVDANYPSGARAVLEDVKKISSKPIKYVVDTHHHPDHAYGNSLFTRAGAITIGHTGVIEEMSRFEPKSWQGVARVRKDVAELNLAAPEPPQQTYTESPHVISDTNRRVELHHFMRGHTRGDTFVYLPREKVLCTGDAVVNGPHSDPKHAYMGNWANEVRAAQKLDVLHVLPGHGSAGGKELLEGQIRFFVALYEAVQAAIKEGKTLDQVVTMQDGRPIATTIQLPRSIDDVYVFHGPGLKPWQVSRLPTQVMATYREITEGKPYGDIFAAGYGVKP
jgi:glyoxylase-like metal-dependent hydrolase (beta-lactamase superfamily II)